MRNFLIAALAALTAVALGYGVIAQPFGLIVGATPIVGGTSGNCLKIPSVSGAPIIADGCVLVLGSSSASVSVSSGTAEVQLGAITVPANSMGANGRLRITTWWSYTNNANNKTLRVRFNGISGTAFQTVVVTTTASSFLQININNNNATNAQKNVAANSSGGVGSTASAFVTAAIDTTATVVVSITGQPASGGDTITLESYLVELIPGV